MVTALFKEGQKAVTTTSLHKYDYGEVLRIKGLSLPQYVAVQFAVDGMSEALPSSIGETVEGVTDVLIPNSLLRSNINPWNYNIMAYVYIVSGSSGKTEYIITIPIKWRPKTGDDQAADDDVAAVIGSAVEKMNTATQRAETAASDAETTAAEIAADREQIQTNTADISSLKGDLTNLQSCVITDNQDAFEVIDDSGNIAFKVDNAGVKARKYILCDEDGNILKTITPDSFTAESGCQGVVDDGISALNVMDEDGNILVKFSDSGVNAYKYNICDHEGNIVKTIGKNSVLMFGDSLSVVPCNPFFDNWAFLNDVDFNKQTYGGNTTIGIGAHSGAYGIMLKDSVTIPAGNGLTQLTVTSTAKNRKGGYLGLGGFSFFNDSADCGKGLNPVTIGGVKGNLIRNDGNNIYSLAFYDASKVYIYGVEGRDSDRGNGKTWNFPTDKGTPAYIRITVNALTLEDAANNTAHVDINGVPVGGMTSVNFTLNKTQGRDGQLHEEIGVCISDYISIAEMFTSIPFEVYSDGLAVPEPVFERTDGGTDSVTVESGTCVYSDWFAKAKESDIVVLYINNITDNFEGETIAERIANQVQPILDIAKGGKYIIALSHYMFHDYSSDVIDQLDAIMRQKHGIRYINMYHYMSQCGISDAIRYKVFTQEQQDAISTNGWDWKRCFLTGTHGQLGAEYENIHENDYGAYLIFRKLLETGVALGYWERGICDWETIYNNCNHVPGYVYPWNKE